MRTLLITCLLCWGCVALDASADAPTQALASTSAPAPASQSLAPTVFIPTCQDIKVFKAKMHAAVDAALKYPGELKFHPAAGVTIVAYDYSDGKVSNAHITQWSGDGRLDRAALNAVKNADFASIVPRIGAQKVHDVVIIVFDNSANTDKNAAEQPKKADPAGESCS